MELVTLAEPCEGLKAAFMKPSDVYAVLKQSRVAHLYHANSVTTSCTFLEQGGLLSRGFVQKSGFSQTAQSSDDVDKKYGIW